MFQSYRFRPYIAFTRFLLLNLPTKEAVVQPVDNHAVVHSAAGDIVAVGTKGNRPHDSDMIVVSEYGGGKVLQIPYLHALPSSGDEVTAARPEINRVYVIGMSR